MDLGNYGHIKYIYIYIWNRLYNVLQCASASYPLITRHSLVMMMYGVHFMGSHSWFIFCLCQCGDVYNIVILDRVITALHFSIMPQNVARLPCFLAPCFENYRETDKVPEATVPSPIFMRAVTNLPHVLCLYGVVSENDLSLWQFNHFHFHGYCHYYHLTISL